MLTQLLIKKYVNISLFTTLKHFETYHRLINLLKNKNEKVTFVFSFLHYCAFSRVVQVLWIYWKQNSFDDYSNWLYFNLVAFENLPDYFNLFSIVYLLYAVKVMHLLYYRNNGICSALLRELLLENNDKFFGKTKVFFKESAKAIKLVFKININEKTLVENIQLFTLFAANCVNFVFILLSKFAVQHFLIMMWNLS